MKEELDLSTMPSQYSLCLNHQCPKAATCLRKLAEQSITNEVKYWNIISPKHLATLKGDCPYYRPCEKVRYAKGFIAILGELPHKQMEVVISRLIGHFNQRTYYRVRKGERPLSPSEQRSVLRIIKNCGTTKALEFDAYYEDYDW